MRKKQWTSQNSYEQNQETLQKLGEKVYLLIAQSSVEEGISNHEIASALNVPTATISGLTRPLVLQGQVRELKKRKCKITGNTVIAWTAYPKQEKKIIKI